MIIKFNYLPTNSNEIFKLDKDFEDPFPDLNKLATGVESSSIIDTTTNANNYQFLIFTQRPSSLQ